MLWKTCLRSSTSPRILVFVAKKSVRISTLLYSTNCSKKLRFSRRNLWRSITSLATGLGFVYSNRFEMMWFMLWTADEIWWTSCCDESLWASLRSREVNNSMLPKGLRISCAMLAAICPIPVKRFFLSASSSSFRKSVMSWIFMIRPSHSFWSLFIKERCSRNCRERPAPPRNVISCSCPCCKFCMNSGVNLNGRIRSPKISFNRRPLNSSAILFRSRKAFWFTERISPWRSVTTIPRAELSKILFRWLLTRSFSRRFCSNSRFFRANS